MGMSNLTDLLGGEQVGGPGAAPAAGGVPAVEGTDPARNFGQRLGDFARDRAPIVSGLALGNGAAPTPAAGVAPVLPNTVEANAKPDNGGLAAILKLIAGG